MLIIFEYLHSDLSGLLIRDDGIGAPGSQGNRTDDLEPLEKCFFVAVLI